MQAIEQGMSGNVDRAQQNRFDSFSPERIDQVIHRAGGYELHRHVEGVLTYGDLRLIANTSGVTLREETWDQIHQIMYGDTTPTLPNFVNRLSTRWIRLIMLKGMMQSGEQHGSRQVEPEVVLKHVFQRVLAKAQLEGLRGLDLLGSPLALSIEGNVSQLPTLDTKVQEEREVLHAWHFRLNHHELPRNVLPIDMPTYFKILQESIEDFPSLYVRARRAEKNDTRMEVGIRFCVRRDQGPEQALKNNSRGKLTKRGQELAKQIKNLYKRGLIHGVDIAGIEDKAEHKLENFRAFFKYLDKHKIPYTVHAGEIIVRKFGQTDSYEWINKELPRREQGYPDIAYDNLRFAIEEIKPIRIAHAYQLLDGSPRMNVLLEKAILEGRVLDLNLTSNLWTGMAKKMAEHYALRALAGDHPLFREKPELLILFRKLVTFNVDDPVINGVSTHPTADEIAEGAKYTNNLDFATEEDLVDHLNTVARRAMIWRRRRKKVLVQ